eukprot:5341098-Pleurochrysis_carterae.AAC.1
MLSVEAKLSTSDILAGRRFPRLGFEAFSIAGQCAVVSVEAAWRGGAAADDDATRADARHAGRFAVGRECADASCKWASTNDPDFTTCIFIIAVHR